MTQNKLDRTKETEPAALHRRLVEGSGLSQGEAQDAVDAYMNAESGMVGETRLPEGFKPLAQTGH